MPPLREKDPNEIGALWNKTTAKGARMLTGKINGEDVVCFEVRSENALAPAWRVLRSKPREQQR